MMPEPSYTIKISTYSRHRGQPQRTLFVIEPDGEETCGMADLASCLADAWATHYPHHNSEHVDNDEAEIEEAFDRGARTVFVYKWQDDADGTEALNTYSTPEDMDDEVTF